MKTKTKIEKKGYKVIFNTGYINDVLSIVSVSAIKGINKVTAKNLTNLYKLIK